jgi:hypothetical protein
MIIAEAFSELLGATTNDGDAFAFKVFLHIGMAQVRAMIAANNDRKPIA